MTAALVSAVAVLATAIVGLIASRAQVAKLRAETALTNDTVNERQTSRLEAEIERQSKVIEYLRQELRDNDRKLRHHREGWWMTYRAAVTAGVDLAPDLHPPFNGEGTP